MSWDNAAYSRAKRSDAKAKGICVKCRHRPALIKRTQCTHCQMGSIIREAFKYDRAKNAAGATAARGTCYVPQFSLEVRAKWVEQVIGKWTGFCCYTGLPIEIGATASLDHCIPISRAGTFGPGKVYSPENLVWCHKAINVLKGDMTADEFKWWLTNELLPSVVSIDQQSNLVVK